MLTLRPAPNTDTDTPSPLALALGGLIALAAAVGIGRFVYTPILPLMVEDLGMTKGAAGLLASANFLGYLAGVLLAATPTAPGSRRNWLLLPLIMSSLTTGAMAFASSTAAFLILRFVGGVASAFVLVLAFALVLDRLSDDGRPDLSAVHFAGVGVGMALSAVLVSSLAAWDTGWRSFWLASGLTSVFASGIVASLMADRVEPTTATTSRPRRTNPRLAALVMADGLFGFGYIITATFLVAIVHASAQVRALEPLVGLMIGLTAAPSVALWTWVGDKLGIAQGFTHACEIEMWASLKPISTGESVPELCRYPVISATRFPLTLQCSPPTLAPPIMLRSLSQARPTPMCWPGEHGCSRARPITQRRERVHATSGVRGLMAVCPGIVASRMGRYFRANS